MLCHLRTDWRAFAKLLKIVDDYKSTAGRPPSITQLSPYCGPSVTLLT